MDSLLVQSYGINLFHWDNTIFKHHLYHIVTF